MCHRATHHLPQRAPRNGASWRLSGASAALRGLALAFLRFTTRLLRVALLALGWCALILVIAVLWGAVLFRLKAGRR
ncbi:hypothetical protein [Parafrigoribacterium soli]|uniref:hypothetical protein n=1 Tax=Parafrigoribacterium soli TaxID=3144663 RepID=UPI0032ED2C7E